ncbi:MAG TPA: thiamine pyrophosphate-dependent enzyme [Bryobacteraceae bacterium]|nr:thiamine pyrophosphate-dependent enzyme [Bryobacteraceae bacterium]
MKVLKQVPDLINQPHDFCPGCAHGTFYRIIQECIEELGYARNQIICLGVGCSCNLNPLGKTDKFQCAHGRAAAVATGMKRVRPDTLIATYQGDGDCGVIGLAETLNAAYRNENITVFTVNNSNFGMTGGQMSWSTLPGQKTATSVAGRDCAATGAPLHLPELIAREFGVAYAARCAVHDAKSVAQAKNFVREALTAQLGREGYSIVEAVGVCPTNQGLAPLEAVKRLKEKTLAEYPTGEFKTRG